MILDCWNSWLVVWTKFKNDLKNNRFGFFFNLLLGVTIFGTFWQNYDCRTLSVPRLRVCLSKFEPRYTVFIVIFELSGVENPFKQEYSLNFWEDRKFEKIQCLIFVKIYRLLDHNRYNLYYINYISYKPTINCELQRGINYRVTTVFSKTEFITYAITFWSFR